LTKRKSEAAALKTDGNLRYWISRKRSESGQTATFSAPKFTAVSFSTPNTTDIWKSQPFSTRKPCLCSLKLPDHSIEYRWNPVVGDAFLVTGVKKTAFNHWYGRHQLAELIATHGTDHLVV
jgi:hypothetical protein